MIDYAVVPTEYYSNVENFKVLCDVDIGGSDHKAIVVTIRGLVKKKSHNRVPRYRWKFENIAEKGEEFRSRIQDQFPGFETYLTERVGMCSTAQGKAEAAWRISRDFINDIAVNTIGKKRISMEAKHEKW